MTTKLTDKQIEASVNQNLVIGDFISYKELMEKIGLDRKTGKSKQLQLENLYRFIEYDYDKDQKKYLITNIYKRHLAKQPRKLREDAIYTKYIEILLLSYFKNNKKPSIIMSKKQWWLTLSMVNSNYLKYDQYENRKKILKLGYSDTMTIENINTFYFRVNKRFTTLFIRALDSLVNRRLIDYERVYMLRYEDDNLFDFHQANDDEHSKILDCEHKALKELEFKSIQQLYGHPEKMIDYYNTIERIQSELYGISEAYSQIKIIYGKKFINTELKYTTEELKELAYQCNYAFKINIDNEAKTTYKNNRITLPNYDISNEDDVNELKIILKHLQLDIESVFIGDIEVKDFINNQNILSDHLLSI